MADVTVRDLADRGDDVVNRVEPGETVLLTRAGVPVRELQPLPLLTSER